MRGGGGRGGGEGWEEDRGGRDSCSSRSEGPHSQLNVPDLYEVKSSEGEWYPATILRAKRNGRYEADLFGGRCAVHYPNIKAKEIRLVQRSHEEGRHDSRSREQRFRADSRGPARDRRGGKGSRKGGRW